jgi:hypothetical protein
VILNQSGKERKLTKTGDEEPSVDTLDGAEVDAGLAETGIDKVVEDGDNDNKGDGVQVP